MRESDKNHSEPYTTGRSIADQMKLLSEVSLSFTGPGIFEEQISQALAMVGSFSGVSRIYIFEDSPGRVTVSNTFEWCSEGTAPEIENLQSIPYDIIRSWETIMKQDGRIYAENIRELPDEIVAILEPQGILSIVVYPLLMKGEIFGFVGFDECRFYRSWSISELELLRTISGLISAVYERSRSQAEMLRRERNFRTMVEKIGELIIIGSMDKRILYCNPAVEKRLAFSADDLIGQPLVQLLPEPDRAEGDRELTRIISEGIQNRTIELQDARGELVAVETRVWPGTWDGEPCIISVSTDLTEQREHLDLLSKVFRSNPAPMALSDAETHRIVEINSAYEEVHGYRRAEVLGRTSAELGYFKNSEGRHHALGVLAETGELHGAQLQVYGKGGRLIDGLFSGVLLTYRGRPHYLTVFVDITEQNRMRADIEEQKRRLEQVIRSTRTGTWEWEIPTGRLIINEELANILGYTRDELPDPFSSELWFRYVHPDDLPEVRKRIEAHLGGGIPYYECELRMKHKGGFWTWVSDQGRIMEHDAEGNPLRMFGTQTDIGRRKREEQELRTSMERALHGAEAKSIYLSHISHEIRTPLNVINGLNSLLLESSLTPRQLDYVKKIRQASEALLVTMQNLLDFSRIETGNVVIDEQDFSIAELFSALTESAAYAAYSRNLELRAEVDASLPPMIRGDVYHVRMILRNLLSNAVKFTENGGVALAAKGAIGSDGKSAVEFAVADTGPGISAERLEVLFRDGPESLPELTTAGDIYSRIQGGSHLALSVSRHLAVEMGGTLTIDSEVGRGSKFRLLLPLKAAAATALADRQPARKTVQSSLPGAAGGSSRQDFRNPADAEDPEGTEGVLRRTALSSFTEHRPLLYELYRYVQLGEAFEINRAAEELRRVIDPARRDMLELIRKLQHLLKTYRYHDALELTLQMLGEDSNPEE